MIYLGATCNDNLEAELKEYASTLENLDYQIMKGGQDIYDVLVGIY